MPLGSRRALRASARLRQALAGNGTIGVVAITRVTTEQVLKRLDAAAKVELVNNLPWPYNGMVADITSAIETGCNYLAALGLSCYTEFCGRELLFGGDEKKKDWECFNEFVRYMGAGDLLDMQITFQGQPIYFKDAVRNGLVHRYFMKVEQGVVAMISDDAEANRLGFLVKEPAKVAMVVVPFFDLFCRGLKRAKSEGRIL